MGKYIETTVEIDLSDLDIDDIIEYLEEEGYTVTEDDDDRDEQSNAEGTFGSSDAEVTFDSSYVADQIKKRMLDLDNHFMHDLMADLAGVSRYSSNDAILYKLKTMM